MQTKGRSVVFNDKLDLSPETPDARFDPALLETDEGVFKSIYRRFDDHKPDAFGARAVNFEVPVYGHAALITTVKCRMQSFGEKPDERAEAANLMLIRIERAVERRGRADA